MTSLVPDTTTRKLKLKGLGLEQTRLHAVLKDCTALEELEVPRLAFPRTEFVLSNYSWSNEPPLELGSLSLKRLKIPAIDFHMVVHILDHMPALECLEMESLHSWSTNKTAIVGLCERISQHLSQRSALSLVVTGYSKLEGDCRILAAAVRALTGTPFAASALRTIHLLHIDACSLPALFPALAPFNQTLILDQCNNPALDMLEGAVLFLPNLKRVVFSFQYDCVDVQCTTLASVKAITAAKRAGRPLRLVLCALVWEDDFSEEENFDAWNKLEAAAASMNKNAGKESGIKVSLADCDIMTDIMSEDSPIRGICLRAGP